LNFEVDLQQHTENEKLELKD